MSSIKTQHPPSSIKTNYRGNANVVLANVTPNGLFSFYDNAGINTEEALKFVESLGYHRIVTYFGVNEDAIIRVHELSIRFGNRFEELVKKLDSEIVFN